MGNQNSVGQYLLAVLRWWWLIIICTAVAGVTSYMGTRQMPRIYQATTTVMVGQTLNKLNPSANDMFIGEQLAETYAQMVKRRPILQGAAEALSLSFVPSAGMVSTRQIVGTQLMEISVRDTDPVRAQALADAIANQLILATPAASEAEERRTFVQDQLVDLEAKIQATGAEIESEQDKLESANSARVIQQHQGNIAALQNKLSSYQANYASMLGTVQGGANNIEIVEPAIQPRYPISPNVPQIVMLAAVIGFALAVTGAFILEFLDDSVRTRDDIVRITGLPFLAAIPVIEGGLEDSKLIVADEPFSPISEVFRVLRTNIRFSSIDKPIFSLMVTSSTPSEGKSVTLANLAVAFAEAGNDVLVVDTDLRKPTQHSVFGMGNAKGLSDAILDGESKVLDYVRPTRVPHLFLLSAGQMPPSPAALLSSERLGHMIDQFRERYQYVLFDSPPALALADAVILSSRVDGVVLAAHAGETRRRLLVQVVEQMRHGQANLLGVTLNRVAGGRGAYGYLYSYYYSGQNGQEQPKGGLFGRRKLRPARKARVATPETGDSASE